MKSKLKMLLAGIFVTAALAAPSVILSSSTMTPDEVMALAERMTVMATYDGELRFSGAALKVMKDGSIQAIFDVSVDKLKNATGTEFYLSYNPAYLTPSYLTETTVDGVTHGQNSFIAAGSEEYVYSDGFFGVDKNFYGKTDSDGKYISPFTKDRGWATVDAGMHEVHLLLQLDQSASGALRQEGEGGEIKKLTDFGGDSDIQEAYVFNHEDSAVQNVVLGQISFRVNKEKAAEVYEYFGNMGETLTPWVGAAQTKLIYVEPVRMYEGTIIDQDPWALYAIKGEKYHRDGNTRYTPLDSNVEDIYKFKIDPMTPIAVELANPVLTINAYQGYTYGTDGDIALALKRYSPVATVTYVDGSKENVVVPWGKNDGTDYFYEYDAYQRTAYADGTYSPIVSRIPLNTFKSTGGHYYPYQTVPVHGVPFPVPVQADLTVTPIRLLSLTANDLEKRYTVSDAQEVVKAPSDLNLPAEARMITDVVPGGVSMVMPIPGWSPIQPDCWNTGDPAISTWPVVSTSPNNESTLMNSLKAKSYDPYTGKPYWPAALDRTHLDITNHPEYFIGDYEFRMAVSIGGAFKDGFTKAEITARFPWLTVDQDKYTIPDARRIIVDNTHLPMDGNQVREYTANYIANTFTDVNGQPSLGISVQRASGDILSNKTVFRIWLPNGQELGTGMTSKDLGPSGGATADPFTVTDWFLRKGTDLPTSWPHSTGTANQYDRDVTWTEGWYSAMPQEQNTGGILSYHLIINPGDPSLPDDTAASFGTERETLRRYINLGGWFKVSVCEDVENYYWSDPIPVYVKPRPNEYTQNKVYNFLGENAGLMKLTGVSGTTVTLPRGYYTTVSDTGLPLWTGDQRVVESYGHLTTYDGMTGAQPGELFQFTVDTGTPWWVATTSPTMKTDVSVGGNPIDLYGPTAYKNGALYQGFGYVYQPAAGNKLATVRAERTNNAETPTYFERITLTSAEPVGITRDPITNNVELAKYNDQTVGYESRQEYLFTITNTGTLDIDGLSIDGLFDGYPQDVVGGRFEMIQAPATFLAVGESTTFVLTYVYDLRANSDLVNIPVYRDTLYITSNRHPVPGKHAGAPVGADYLLDFDAEVLISSNKLHNVEIRVYPQTINDSDLNGDKTYKHPITYPMGNADVIIGQQVEQIPDVMGAPGSTVDKYTMDYTSATRRYAEKTTVYIVVRPEDEYTVASIVCSDPVDPSIPIPRYGVDAGGKPWPKTKTLADGRVVYSDGTNDILNVAVLDDGTQVYTFEMPAYDAVVTIRFEETNWSKMRLSSLIDYSAGPNCDSNNDRIDQTTQFNVAGTADARLKTVTKAADGTHNPATGTVAPEDTYQVWRKSFTQAELDRADEWCTVDYAAYGLEERDLYLMTVGRVIPHNYEDPSLGGDVFNSSQNQYLVVIPYEADRSQVEATLRKIVVDIDGVVNDATGKETPDDKRLQNENIQPDVVMRLFGTHFMTKTAVDRGVTVGSANNIGDDESVDFTGNPAENGRLIYRNAGDTAGPTVHTSEVFDSPAPGASKYVRIAIQLGGETRFYYLEIRRRTADPEVELHYGNSPYGMIMNNESKFNTDVKQEAAKAAFRAGYTFKGAAPADVPTAVLDQGLNKAVYWREAWVKNCQLFEPESGLGRDWVFLYSDPPASEFLGNEWRDIPSVYDPADNLDLNDYSYFAILGEDMHEPGIISAKDSSGRPMKLSDISAAVTVTLLDVTQDKQVNRFSGTGSATIDLGVAGRLLTTIAGKGIASADLTKDNWPVASAPGVDGEGNPVINYTEIQNIRPGRYELVYTYTDYDGINTLSVVRPFVVLAPVGDVNADLVRNSGWIPKASSATGYEPTDEYVMENRVVDPLGFTAGTAPTLTEPAGGVYPYANIFRFRVCDANNDRNINNIDSNQIRQNVKADLADSTTEHFLRFYHPTKYGLGT